jgi:hypothetical protein
MTYRTISTDRVATSVCHVQAMHCLDYVLLVSNVLSECRVREDKFHVCVI